MRVLIVLLAYACAALVAPALILVYGTATSGVSESSFVSEFLFAFAFFGPIAAIYALPVSLPVIIATERRKRGDWRIFALAGIILGGIITILFTELPFSWSNLGYSAILLPIAFTCAMTYWAVAWKWFPPQAKAVSPLGK